MSAKTEFWQEVDVTIVKKAQAGDMSAFKQIYLLHSKDCYRLAYNISLNESIAQDIVQDCFVDVINKIDQYKGKGSFAGWLRTMVARKALNKVVTLRRLQSVDELQMDDHQSSSLFDSDWLSQVYDIEKLLAELPDKLRTILVLHEIEGLTHKEIANQFGQSESFSKVNLMRAYELLKTRISITKKGAGNAPK